MNPLKVKAAALFFSIALLLGINTQAVAVDKSLAETKVVLQISDPNPFKQTLVLNVADNLKKLLGPELVDVEIVAFGPGLRLLQEGNANTDRIKSLVGQGVQFSACAQTMKKMTKILGEKPALNPQAKVVTGGVTRIIELQKQGFTLIKP